MNESAYKLEDVGRNAPDVWQPFCSGGELVDLVSDLVFVFDAELRVVCVNAAFASAFGKGRGTSEKGCSFGKVLDCRHAANGVDCGGREACGVCGWFLAADAARKGRAASQECRILTCSGTAFDFEVRTSPASTSGYGLCSLTDVFAGKRLRVLERSVFHDVTNLAVGVKGLLDFLDVTDAEQTETCIHLIHDNAKKMTREIMRLRTLREAESGTLEPFCVNVSARGLVQDVMASFQEEASARHVTVCADDAADFYFQTDQELFCQMLGNLLLNAIEASKRDDRVTVGYSADADSAVFCVRNPYVFAHEDRLKVFERSFSTKGKGKGVGVYGAKLIAERYLKGQLDFVSQAPEGTVFFLRVPLSTSGETRPAGRVRRTV